MSGHFPIPSINNPTKLDSIELLDGQDLKILFDSALTWLRANQQIVNALNVFPVPDGDTGTNMVLTMQAAQSEAAGSQERNVGKMAHTLAQGALMGARGNSGVILSQLLRGFARAMDNLEYMDITLMSNALSEARNTAYKGVVRPVEGTILTVAKDMATASENYLTSGQGNNMISLLEVVVSAGDESVKKTPELLPILKQANVVDSGGKGLFFIFEGMLRHLKGLPLDTPTVVAQPIPLSALKTEETMESIEPGQDYEVVIDFRPFNELNFEKFYADLSEIGTSIQVGEGDGMYRMHIHVPTENRYTPIDYTMSIGTVTKVAIENLMDQMATIEGEKGIKIDFPVVEPGQIAVVAVSPGDGISQIFASLGAAAVVGGGQTMNPSTEEILSAFENLPTDKIIILPNNKNIVMAAQNASAASVKKVEVIPSTSVPQGLSALLHLLPDGDYESVVKNMVSALKDVETGEITTATRSVNINGVDVRKGEVIALLNGKLVASSETLENACLELLEKADTASRERITLFYGNNIESEEVTAISDKIQEKYPSHEIEIHNGGQPHYQFIIAIE